MTLGEGNVLAKVQKNKDGQWELVTGEQQHLFLVVKIPDNWGVQLTETGHTFVRPTLLVAE